MGEGQDQPSLLISLSLIIIIYVRGTGICKFIDLNGGRSMKVFSSKTKNSHENPNKDAEVKMILMCF